MKHINRIEKIQKFACKIALHSWNQDYSSMLAKLNLQPLRATEEIILEINLFYNIFHKHAYFPSPLPITVLKSDYDFRHNSLYIRFISHSIIYNSFFPCISRFLNNNPVLLTNFIDCNSCSAFKFCALDYINVY